jgi:hypothetical protein
MKKNTFQLGIDYLRERMSQLPDKRVGDNAFISMRDIGLSAFSVFFTQSSSFLEHQKLLQKRAGKSNAHSLFKIEHIPSDNHIREMLDEVPPSELFPVYDYLLGRAKEAGELDSYRHLDNKFLMPFDGLHYFSSEKIHCANCSFKHHQDGSISTLLSAILVHPNKRQVLPLPPEFIEPQDGQSKQDCELSAAKRWLLLHGKKYVSLGIIVLGDDLYCHQPFCKLVVNVGYDFIFICKPESHKSLYEDLEGLSKTDRIKTIEIKHEKEVWHCSYINQLALKDGEDSLKVNWCELSVYNKEGKQTYHNSFATNMMINDRNVFKIVQAGRTRWKTENEFNNALKNHGYLLAHNFGHGKKHLSSLLAAMIMLSFLFHTLLLLTDRRYRAIRSYWPKRTFFQHLRTLLFYMYFATWDALMECMVNAGEFDIDTS